MSSGFYYALNGSASAVFHCKLRAGRAVKLELRETNKKWAKPERKEDFAMAKITIAGDAIVVTSALTLKELATLEKYNPKALSLYEDKEETFRVCTGGNSISEYGACFGSETHDEAKKATITLEIPRGVQDAKEYAVELVGGAVMNLDEVEKQANTALETVKANMDKVRESIQMA